MKTYKILDNAYILEDIIGCCCNLIIGTNKALVFDTCSGFENLYDGICKITNLDLIVINSHGYFDHIGGNYQFNKVYLHKEDLNLPLKLYDINETRNLMIEYYQREIDKVFLNKGWDNLSSLSFDFFDLGNLTCEIKHIPGHTKGSIGILIPKLKLFLSGDTLSPSICLNFPNALAVDEMISTLFIIKSYKFEWFITSHHTYAFKKKYIDYLINCCEKSKCEKKCKFISPLNPTYIGKLYIYSIKDSMYGECISIIE